MARNKRTWMISALLVLLLLVGTVAAGLHFAIKALKGQIEEALGKESEVGSIHVGLSAVTISDLRIKAPPGWPAEDALRAKRIDVSPDWRALLTKHIALSSIHIEGAYLSVLRASNGKIQLLPSLLGQQQKQDKQTPPPPVSITQIDLTDAALEFFDATITKPPHKVRLEDVRAHLDNLHLPELTGTSDLSIEGKIKGVKTDGTIVIKGPVELATKNSEIVTTLRGVDLMALQPYLLKSAKTGVKHGTLDLDIKATVKQRHLHAPGVVTLHQLELDDGDGGFMGLPRQAAVGILKDGNETIQVKFVLEGNLDDPQFSINESLAKRFGASLADTLGVSVGNLGKSIGGAASGIGGALKGVFGK